MIVDGRQMRPIGLGEDQQIVRVIDQRKLPHQFVVEALKTVDDAIRAIHEMYVRGAPLIGVTGAYGVYLATLNAPTIEISESYLRAECDRLISARPTAVNLSWGVETVFNAIKGLPTGSEKREAARTEALRIEEWEADNCRKIGENGLSLIQEISDKKGGRTVNILTHCNAGWLACIEYGTATAPIYAACDRGIDLHVWVDETRPLNQGSRLTAWELGKHGIHHTVITDNAGGHLMQHGKVDLVIVGTDRTTCTGDVANKIGTYLKALAAKDNHVPFYVALPSSTFDWSLRDGIAEIPIEERNPEEVQFVDGFEDGRYRRVLVTPANSPAANFAFDVTPARLVTGFITERGLCKATEQDILRLFPERKIRSENPLVRQ